LRIYYDAVVVEGDEPGAGKQVLVSTNQAAMSDPKTSSATTIGSAGVMHILSSPWTTSLLLFYTVSIPPVLALRESGVGVICWGETFPARVDLRLPKAL